MIEVNGPANIIMILEQMYWDELITEQHFLQLKNEALKTISYMSQLSNPRSIHWHEVTNVTKESA